MASETASFAQVLYAFVANKTMGICTVLLGGLGNTANPAIASILSAHTPASQQVNYIPSLLCT